MSECQGGRSAVARMVEVPPAVDSSRGRTYPFAVVRAAKGFSAGALQFASMAAAATRDELHGRLAELVALFLVECEIEGVLPVQPAAQDVLDVSAYRAEGLDPEIVYVGAAPVCESSVAIQRAMREEGVHRAELARRMGVGPSVVTRIADPFYFGHTSRTLRRVAEGLGRELLVVFAARGAAPGLQPGGGTVSTEP